MFHGIAVEIGRLKVEKGLKLKVAWLPVEGLKIPPYISRRDIGGFQPTGQRRLKMKERTGAFSTGLRETSRFTGLAP